MNDQQKLEQRHVISLYYRIKLVKICKNCQFSLHWNSSLMITDSKLKKIFVKWNHPTFYIINMKRRNWHLHAQWSVSFLNENYILSSLPLYNDKITKTHIFCCILKHSFLSFSLYTLNTLCGIKWKWIA